MRWPAIYGVAELLEHEYLRETGRCRAVIEVRDQPEPDGAWIPVPIDQYPFVTDRRDVMFRMTVGC
jgi:hypothetical protein